MNRPYGITEVQAVDYPNRKPIRLTEYDYASPGAYFVTVCTHDRRCILSRIDVGEGLAPPVVTLTPIGQCVEEQIRALPLRYPSVQIDSYIIMPNHIHLIVTLRETAGGASPSPTSEDLGQQHSPALFDVIRVLKSLTTRLSRDKLGSLPLWQRSYYEHIIRSEDDYRQIGDYIASNPGKWAEDRYYMA